MNIGYQSFVIEIKKFFNYKRTDNYINKSIWSGTFIAIENGKAFFINFREYYFLKSIGPGVKKVFQ
jgi:hypothetical protein